MTQPIEPSPTPLRRALVVGYGTLVYLFFLGVLIYTIGFLADFGVPKGINDGPEGSLAVAVVVDAALLALFAVQHSVMARPWFKRWWTRFVPASIERSTYVLATSLVVALLFWQWRPLPDAVWSVDVGWAAALLWTIYGLGWILIVISTFAIDHFDLFGLRQVVTGARGRRYEGVEFRQPLLYRLVRHPLMVGFLIAFWATPEMSVGRLLFAVLATGYILVAVHFEEHDLRAHLGEPYDVYARQVPRYVPRLVRRTRVT